jgi:uncharacterized membrane protein YhaH (DUF805 family)
MTNPPDYQPPTGDHAAPGVTFSQAINLGIHDWGFSRRGSRSEYWWLVLAYIPVSIVLSLLSNLGSGVRFITDLAALAVGVVFIKAMIRRYHDIGRSGWWLIVQAAVYVVSLILVTTSVTLPTGSSNTIAIRSSDAPSLVLAAAIVIATWVWSLVWLCLPGKPEANRWG